ncbi:Uma2 family endonuclease [Pendulispora albinea]|uniref:Uma2 family endonuclease n=1 Tax=Pendulispora albinea TaxID=2741071 RepID=A0ABZ2MBM3_9BACT
MVAHANPRLMTLEEWAELDDGESGELVDGYLEEEEMGSFIHDFVVLWLGSLLLQWIAPRGGHAAASEVKFGVTTNRGRKPDLTVFFPGRRPEPRGLVRLPPDIAVEVISHAPRDRRRDRVAKLSEYAAFGIRYYWLVDPDARIVEIFELGSDGRYVLALGAFEGRITSVPGCEGLELHLDDLWLQLDRLEGHDSPEAAEAEEIPAPPEAGPPEDVQ